MVLTQEQQLRLDQLNDVFRPAGPVLDEQLFIGRVTERDKITSSVSTPGQHVAIYGERGVGKTSIAGISVNSARARDYIAVRVNCSPEDDFQMIWDSAVDHIVEEREMPWWNRGWDESVEGFLAIMGRDTAVLAEPDRIRLALSRLSQATRVLVVFDEYDQIEDPTVSKSMASTIKTLSDHLVNATIAIVGVANSIDDLIEGHLSIRRCLEQVPMPRMSPDELRSIVEHGLREVNISISSGVLDFIASASMGFPQYAHLLGKSFARCAILRNSYIIESSDLIPALSEAVSGVEQSIRAEYNAAVFSPNSRAHYKNVLLACALAQPDSEGFFTPKDLAAALSLLLGRTVRSDTYNKHLIEFVEDRGPVLERKGQKNRWRYRFRDPALGPYVILEGAVEGVVRFGLAEAQLDQPDRPNSTWQQPLF